MLYQDVLLPDCEAIWCEQPRLRYQEQFAQLLKQLIISQEQSGAAEVALNFAQRLVEAEPYQEWSREAVVRLYLKTEQPQAALTAYQEYVRCWQAELALPPSDRMQKLCQAIKNQTDSNSTIDVLQTAVTQLSQLVTNNTPSESLIQATQAATNNLCCATAKEAERIGAVAEAEFAWEMAQQAYQTGLAVLKKMPDEPDFLHRQFDLHLRCDMLYDRAAQREPQKENLDQALNLAKKLNDKGKQSELYARHCWVATRKNKLQQAIRWGSRALLLAGKKQKQRAQALRLLGISYEQQGSYANALSHHLEALELDANQPQFLTLDYTNLASVYLSMGEDWLAWQHIQTAWNLTPTNPPSLIQAVILGNLSNIARERGDFTLAISHLQAAQKIAEMLGDRETDILLATRAATLYRQTDDIPRARRWASYAWQESQRIEQPRCAVEAALECARLAYLASDQLVAEQWVEQLVELLKANELGRYRGSVCLLQALGFLQDHHFAAAYVAAKDGLTAVLQAKEHPVLPLAHTLLSLVLFQQDKHGANKHLMLAHHLLCDRINKIPDPAFREQFLQATPLQIQLSRSAYPTVSELLQYG